MRAEKLFGKYERNLKELEKYKKELDKDFKEAKENTQKFLKECQNVGIQLVSIGTKTDKIESAKEWRSWNHSNSIFADEEYGDWPAIWKVADMENGKYNGGCGNSGQHQFNCSRFIEGVYEFKDGKWKMLEEGE